MRGICKCCGADTNLVVLTLECCEEDGSRCEVVVPRLSLCMDCRHAVQETWDGCADGASVGDRPA